MKHFDELRIAGNLPAKDQLSQEYFSQFNQELVKIVRWHSR
ncbi:MAG: hypothetical protein ACI97A_004290 [Planctomycetota bacterium]